jgi:hypothetical protein
MVPLRRGHSLLLHISLAKLLNRGVAHADLYIPTIVVGDTDACAHQSDHLPAARPCAGRSASRPAVEHPARGASEDARRAGARFACLCPLLALGKTVLLGRAAGVRRLGGRHQFLRRHAAHRFLAVPRTGLRHHHPAPAADPLGCRTCLSGRRNDCAADRHHLGLQAVFVVRPDRYLHFDDRLSRYRHSSPAF